jgi:hypothetical protein
MRLARWTILGAGLATTALTAGQTPALITSSWQSSASAESGYVQNELEVFSSLDWISAQLRVELNSGQFFYVDEGVAPGLNPTLLVGDAANTSLTFPAAGDPNDPLNSQIPGFELLPNAGTAGPGGLGGSASAIADLNTFDLTYFGPPDETDDVALVTPLKLAQMTASDDAFGTWALRLRNSDPNDPQNQPAQTLYASGFVFKGVFYNTQIPGDTDNDGDIDDADLGISFSNYTGPVGIAGGKSLADGDTDGDGDVDDADLGTSFSNYTGPLAPPAASAVPEPGSAVFVVLSTTLLLGRKRSFSRTPACKPNAKKRSNIRL